MILQVQSTKLHCTQWADEYELNILGVLTLVITVILWISELLSGKRPMWGDSKTAAGLLKNMFCMFGLIRPINFMENRKGSFVVACMFGTLASLIFREVVNPTDTSFVKACFWTALLYPVFICRTCTNKTLGAYLGAFYSLVLTGLLWYQLGCRQAAEEYTEAAYNVLPCLGALVFLLWYLSRVFRKKSLEKFGVWQEFDHRSLVEVLLLPPSENTPVEGRNFFLRVWHGARKDWTRSIMHFRYSPRMLAMVMMCYCMLLNFMIWLGAAMNDLSDYLTSELSGGLCCSGAKCDTGDMYLWQLWTRNSSTPLFDTGTLPYRWPGFPVFHSVSTMSYVGGRLSLI